MFGAGLDAPSDVATLQVPHDRARSFADCDAWILFGDAALGAVAWLRPTIVIAPQMAERYAPAFADQQDIERRIDSFLSWRRARGILAVTAADRRDLVSFAGVHPDRVRPLPALSDLIPKADHVSTPSDEPRIVWHPSFPWPAPATVAARAWREYLEAGGSLPLSIIGRHAAAVVSVPAVASILDECSGIGGRWQVRSALPGRRLDRILDRAEILWNPSVADDAHWLLARAVAQGVRAVAADAPHLRGDLLGDIGQISTLWTYPGHDIVAAANALLAAAVHRPTQCAARLSNRCMPPEAVSWRETLETLLTQAA